MLWNSVKRGTATLILAHGAGAPMDSPFMDYFADELAKHKIRVGRFEFPYMARRRSEGVKAPPNSESILLDSWRQEIRNVRAKRLFIGGKSMGGRMASMVADECEVTGLICLGYPFHPPGKPERLRTEHLVGLQTPTLIVQGERDTFGKLEEVEDYELSSAIQFAWMTDGDHSLKPRKASGKTLEDNLSDAVSQIVEFVASA